MALPKWPSNDEDVWGDYKKKHWCGSLHSGKTTLRRRQMQAGQMVAQPLAKRVERLFTSWTECWTQTCQNNQKSDRLRKKCRIVLMSKMLRTWESSSRRKIQRQSDHSRLNPSCELTAEQWVSAYSVSSWSWKRSHTGINLWLYTALDLSDWICKINCWINAKKKLHSNYVYKRIISKSYMISIIVILYANVWKYTYISYHIMLVTYYKSYL